MVLPLVLAFTPLYFVQEAEDCEVEMSAPRSVRGSVMASGGKATPPGWGSHAGDRIRWTLPPQARTSGPKWLAVRYAYDAKEFGPDTGKRHTLEVLADDRLVARLSLSHTGSWDSFRVVWLRVDLGTAATSLTLRPSADGMNVDIDCLGIASNPKGRAPLVDSELAHNPRFTYLSSPAARPMSSKVVLAEFDRIYREMQRYGDWTPATPVGIHAVEDRNWPNGGWAAFSNDQGLFLRTSVMSHDQGNWCHEMTHLMFRGRIPAWLDESLVHVLTKHVWVPRLYLELEERQSYKDELARWSQEFAAEPTKMFASLQMILGVMLNRYGPDFYGRFFRACTSITGGDSRRLSNEEVLRAMKEAAGEDVTPYFMRWTGFDAVRAP